MERLSKDRYKSCLQNSLGGSACPLDSLMWTIAWPSKTSQCWEGLGSSEGCGPKLLLGKGSSWTVKIEESPSPFQRPIRASEIPIDFFQKHMPFGTSFRGIKCPLYPSKSRSTIQHNAETRGGTGWAGPFYVLGKPRKLGPTCWGPFTTSCLRKSQF